MEGPRETRLLRGLAQTIASVAEAEAAAVLVVEPIGEERSIAIYASSFERTAGGATSPWAVTHPLTTAARGMLAGDIVLTDDVRALSGYMPLWSDDAALRGGAMLSVAVRRDDEPIGVMIARRPTPFTRADFDALRLLDDVAAAAIINALPAVACDRCGQYVDDAWGLVALVQGQWVVGHKKCYTHEETGVIWLSLTSVREQPIWYTRVATTDRLTPETLTSEAVTSWYRILGEILPFRALPYEEADDEGGRPVPIEGFTVRDRICE